MSTEESAVFSGAGKKYLDRKSAESQASEMHELIGKFFGEDAMKAAIADKLQEMFDKLVYEHCGDCWDDSGPVSYSAIYQLLNDYVNFTVREYPYIDIASDGYKRTTKTNMLEAIGKFLEQRGLTDE